MNVLKTVCCLAIGLTLSSQALNAKDLEIERLTWAGVKFSTANTTVILDGMTTDIWNGNAPQGFVAATADTSRRYALVSHTHNDHFDAGGLPELLGDRGYVISLDTMATNIASRGFKVISTPMYVPVERGGFVFIPVPAIDGFGSEQISWIIKHKEGTFLHGGDTLWHGGFELLGKAYGPFDAVFLPINSPVVGGEGAIQQGRVMTPEQAVDAAVDLGANVLVPIHYGFTDPPGYVETTNPLERVKAALKGKKLNLQALKPGEKLQQ